MSSIARKVQRNHIRYICQQRDGNTKAFKEEWDKLRNAQREKLIASGVNVRKKHEKRARVDNGKVLLAGLRRFKKMIESMQNANKKNKEN